MSGSGAQAATPSSDAGGDAGSVPPTPPPVVEGGAEASPPAPACAPQSGGAVTSIPWAPPTTLHKNACTLEQASRLVECLFTTVGTTPQCDDFFYRAANAGCVSCAITSTTASRLGPINDDGTNYYTNVSGCVAGLSGDVSASGCGPKLDALYGCADVACTQCSDATYGECFDAAGGSVCATQAGPAGCAKPYLDACSSNISIVDEALKLVKVFCVP